jgi:hypothetical protein
MLSSPRNFGHDSQQDQKMFEIGFNFLYKYIVGFKAEVSEEILNWLSLRFSLRAEL